MSKLPNAPLREVIFELKWEPEKKDLSNFQFFLSDMYASLKDDYPERENLLPPEIPIDIAKGAPAFRFRTSKNGYPLYQIGNGLFTFNVDDNNYFREDFFNSIDRLLNEFVEAKSDSEINNIQPTLTYLDFIEVDYSKTDINSFINRSFNFSLNQSFYNDQPPSDLKVEFDFDIKGNKLRVTLKKGKLNNNKEGLVLVTKFIGEKTNLSSSHFIEWLKLAQETCSDVFKKITEGELYESFKTQQ